MKLVNNKNENGFILLDSLGALVILSLALLALAGLATMGVRAYNTNNQQMKAYQIASGYADALESLQISDWGSLVTSPSYTTIDLTTTPVSTVLNNANIPTNILSGASVTVSAKQSSDASVSNLLAEVKIVVSWNNGGAQSIQLFKQYVRSNPEV